MDLKTSNEDLARALDGVLGVGASVSTLAEDILALKGRVRELENESNYSDWSVEATGPGPDGLTVSTRILARVDPLIYWAMCVGFAVVGDYGHWGEANPSQISLRYRDEIRRVWKR